MLAAFLALAASGAENQNMKSFKNGSGFIRDFDLWTLGDTYFEACIHRAPHTELAESCYRKLEESTLAGYTGSAGTQVPLDVEKKLTRLREEARAAAQAPGKPKRF